MRVRSIAVLLVGLFVGAPVSATAQPLPVDWEAQLFRAREAAWRHFFSQPDKLAAMLTDDFVAIDGEETELKRKAFVISQSREVVASGVELRTLRFPTNIVQRYGAVAIIYTTYEYTLAVKGEVGTPRKGRATENFVWDGTVWLHSGWHLDSVSSP